MKRAIFLSVICVLVLVPVRAKAASQAIYDENANAHQQIAAAIAQASKTGKNIALDFGANWCPDCHALDSQMHSPELSKLIAKNYVMVHIDVGRFDKNIDIAKKYGVPIQHGIPAVAILDSHGKLLFAQDQGQFADARSMTYDSFLEFFKKWQPER